MHNLEVSHALMQPAITSSPGGQSYAHTIAPVPNRQLHTQCTFWICTCRASNSQMLQHPMVRPMVVLLDVTACAAIVLLQELSLRSCGDVGPGDFLQHLPALRKLDAAWCRSLSPQQVEHHDAHPCPTAAGNERGSSIDSHLALGACIMGHTLGC